MQSAPRYTDETGLGAALEHAKLWACPRCGRTGALVGHGLVRGYGERDGTRVVRGRRLLCSNRHRRPGCGRTFSILRADVIATFLVRAPTLYQLVRTVIAGASRRAAWRVASAGAMSMSSGYRLWRRLGTAQVGIRTRLCRARPPPASTRSEPLAQMVAHLEHVFPEASCPLTAFQSRWQTSVLG